jgi:hypothetical protein
MPFSGQGGRNSLRQQAYWRLDQRARLLMIACRVSVAVRPSGLRSATALSICCLRPATRTSKNSSRLELNDAKELDPFQQRRGRVQRLLQHALVEFQASSTRG